MSIFSKILELYFSGLKSILFYTEYQKMFLSGFFLVKKKKWEKGWFFDKNHGLTPWQNAHFFYFARVSKWKMSIFSKILELHFLGLKSILFYTEYQKCFFLAFFWSKKKNMRKRLIFWQKPWTNHLAKCRFFLLC